MSPQPWPLSKFLPKQCLEYCYDLWRSNDFEIKVVPPRSSKLGDFRFDSSKQRALITINLNLNRYHFLVVYLHEVAHYLIYKSYQNRVKPHGKEWKLCFAKLLAPLIEQSWIPHDLAIALSTSLKNPKAASCSDKNLTKALRKYDVEDGLVNLEQLPQGTTFKFHRNSYQKLETRRTRALCKNLHNGRRYLISLAARVEPAGAIFEPSS